MEKDFINYEMLPWKKLKYKGLESKLLRSENGAVTILLKMPAGYSIAEHLHIKTEQHVILKGQYVCDGNTYGAGTYRIIHSGTNHRTCCSKNGAIILIIRDAV